MDGVSPYASSPHTYLNVDLTNDWEAWKYPIDRFVAHADLASIYPPVAEATFISAQGLANALPAHWDFGTGATSRAYRDLASEAADEQVILANRIILSLGAFVAAIVMIAILRHLNQSVWWSVLFAWNPLVIIDTGAMPHVDIVGIVFILLTILMLLKNRALPAGIMLALACGVKPQAMILLPWLLRDISTNNPLHSRRRVARSLGGFAIACAVIYIPALVYQHGYRGFFSTFSEYSSRWEFNGSIYEVIKSSFGEGDDGCAAERAKSAARMLALSATVLAALLLWKSRATFIEAGYWLFLVGLLFSPVVYPWYLLWILGFIPLLRGKHGWSGLTWCATIGVSYAVWHQPQWRLPASLALLEYAPVFVMVAIEIYFCTRKRLPRAATSAGGGAILQY